MIDLYSTVFLPILEISRLGIPLLLTLLAFAVVRQHVRRRGMPPGPRGLPWIGNKHQVPAIKPWWKFAEWNREYGPVVSIHLGSTPVIILGTAQAAWDLLDKRSDIYSSRPRFVVAGEILSDNKRGLMLPYGDSWRKWRKVLHSGFHSRRAETYHEIQTLESAVLVHELLTNPAEYEKHLTRFAASVATSVTYGRRVDSADGWIVKENLNAMACGIPGKYLVETWPWLLKLPRSLQWFRREPEAQRQRDIALLTHLLNDVKKRMSEGTIPDCLTSQTVANQEKNGLTDVEIAYTVASPFGAGIETTSGTLCIFFLAMLHYPEAMRKAQAELDSVVGRDRLPTFDDREKLPYVNALISETLRWRPIAVLGGSPHAVTTDDEYHGMHIPKGATVFANLAGIMRDPALFPAPDAFRPERFLESSADPRLREFDLPFGFGRRVCVGVHLARASLFVAVSRVLWAFDVVPAPGARGLPDPWAFTDGFNSRPVSFPCGVVRRSARAAEVVEAEWEGARERLARW
ncbi:cytochrome P450 [Epithele typhae]|uniref:cytochrome P450 n=1 Tax=Epithele typhae TaxID=378194 RepID=UPI0020079838|nr:cytochrome P450 [Epithele typhae]KAH9937759.1 cytochrome P450 [Epithele typhae]